MTPEELHSRILLHELRTILLDETREGGQLPEERKQILRDDPHNPSHYLILADFLEDQGSELGELCRIQVELIGLLPVDYTFGGPLREPRIDQHPFQTDYGDHLITGHDPEGCPCELLERRWEIVEPLYPRIDHAQLLTAYLNFQKGEKPERTVSPRKLGRTTRMLTDVLRYCCLNQGKNILVRLPGDEVEQSNLEFRFDRLCREVWGREPAWLETHTAHMPDCRIHFGDTETNRFIRTHRTSRTLAEDREMEPRLYARQRAIESGFDPMLHFETGYSIEQMAWLSVQEFPPDTTFTDHACQQRSEWDDMLADVANRYMAENQQEVERRQLLYRLLLDGGKIQFNPAVFINPDNL